MASNVNETNPAILRAELSFYSGPHSEDYENDVYSTLKKIELTCANDYDTICSAFTKDASFIDTTTKEALGYHKSSGPSRPDGNHGRIDYQDNKSPVPHDPLVVSLGYGDAGDMCMYLNNAKLSNSCQLVVTDFRDLKEKYRKEEPNATRNPGERDKGFMNVVYSFYAIATFAIIISHRNCIKHKRQKMKEMRAIVDPTLNAQRKSCFRDYLYQNVV